MLKYAKIENEETKQVSVGLGTNTDFYKSIGMIEMEVEQAYNGSWYLQGYVPKKPAPTREEISALREQFYNKKTDKYSCEKIRKTAIGKWTEEDEQQFVKRMTDLEALVQHLYPYTEEEQVKVELTDGVVNVSA